VEISVWMSTDYNECFFSFLLALAKELPAVNGRKK